MEMKGKHEIITVKTKPEKILFLIFKARINCYSTGTVNHKNVTLHDCYAFFKFESARVTLKNSCYLVLCGTRYSELLSWRCKFVLFHFYIETTPLKCCNVPHVHLSKNCVMITFLTPYFSSHGGL